MSRSLVPLLVVSSFLTVPAQQRNPEEQPRKVKQELKKAYRVDVRLLRGDSVSSAERMRRAAFKC